MLNGQTYRLALEDQAQTKSEHGNDVDTNEDPAGPPKPNGHSLNRPDAKIQLQNRDLGDHDNHGVYDFEHVELLRSVRNDRRARDR